MALEIKRTRSGGLALCCGVGGRLTASDVALLNRVSGAGQIRAITDAAVMVDKLALAHRAVKPAMKRPGKGKRASEDEADEDE